MFKGITELRYKKADVILFNSHRKDAAEVLSNHHLCKLSYNGLEFNSTEQLFFVMRLSNHPKYQEVLMQCSAPVDVKRKGQRLMDKVGYDDSDPSREIPLLRFCIRLKYLQCDEFRDFLLSHPKDKYVEYAPWGDKAYGTIDEDLQYKWDWNKGVVYGQNVCGRIIRGVLKEALQGNVKLELPDGVTFPSPLLL